MTENSDRDIHEGIQSDVQNAIEEVQFQASGDPDKEYTTTIRMFSDPRVSDGEPHISISGTTVVSSESHKEMEAAVLDQVDLRKAPTPSGSRGVSFAVGVVTYLGTGEVIEIDIHDKYLKPTERSDKDGEEQ